MTPRQLLKSTDDESFDQCVSCLSSKMKKKSFPHRLERVIDLLGLIHTDVCGPLRHVPRQGASYFITFTNDYSRYGYIYLLKHKHKVFETFKVFKNEVENQLKKTIKALESAEHILYMVPTKKVDKTPYELWYGKVPNLSYLKETMGYYFYFTPENKIVFTRYAELFDKNLLSLEVSGRAGELEEIQDEDTSPSEITSKIPMEVEEVEEHSLGDLNEPANYKVAMLDSKSNKWLDAMNAKMQSMKDNQVWHLVDLLPDCKTVGSKWIFKKKTDMDGIVHTYKAIFVAKGYTQLYEVDYEEMFSPVADIRAIRILIAIAAYYDNEIWKVCKLQRSIYGLKQASRSWNKSFDDEVKRFGFTQNLDDPCVYQMATGTELRVDCYCDAGFETNRDDTKSQTGYVFLLNRGTVD
nr:hypothetical protein [Tanacetum cinerariifolium]